jgi:hypothetical protein
MAFFDRTHFMIRKSMIWDWRRRSWMLSSQPDGTRSVGTFQPRPRTSTFPNSSFDLDDFIDAHKQDRHESTLSRHQSISLSQNPCLVSWFPVAGNLSSHGGTSFEASISYLCWSRTPHHEDAPQGFNAVKTSWFSGSLFLALHGARTARLLPRKPGNYLFSKTVFASATRILHD